MYVAMTYTYDTIPRGSATKATPPSQVATELEAAIAGSNLDSPLKSDMCPLRRYFGMLLWSLSLVDGRQNSERSCSVLYGIAVGTMWLRMLDFVLVQKDLGKVQAICATLAGKGYYSLLSLSLRKLGLGSRAQG